MKLLLYSASERISVKLTNFSQEEERILWDELTWRSDIVNGWTNGCARLINSEKTISNFNSIEIKYINRFPQVQQISHFPKKKVSNNAMFYVFNDTYATLADKMCALEVLKCDDVSNSWESIHNKSFEAWSILSHLYDIDAFGIDGKIKEHIGGNLPIKDRICRFCREPSKKYKKIAHAIPEAIGNKILICDDECDDCNQDLEPIEKNFTLLMDFRRAMYRIARKNSNECATIYGKNYTIAPDDKGNPILYIKESEQAKGLRLPDGNVLFTFHHSESVVDQNIYRALVKMVIDVCSSNRLSYFQKTIDWIMNTNGEILKGALPSILFGILPEGNFYNNPVLYLFFRKNNDFSNPYCTAVLFITDVAYQFVVPFAEPNGNRFKYDDELVSSRNQLNKFFNIQWESQACFSWWKSTIWNQWDIDLSHTNIIFKPDNEAIFVRIPDHDREYLRNLDKMIFFPKDIEESNVQITNQDKFLYLIRKDSHFKVSRPLHINANLITSDCSLNVYLQEKKSGENFIITSIAKVRDLDRFYSISPYITGNTFESLVESIWRKMCRKADRIISMSLRKQNLFFMRNLILDSFITSTKYEIYLPNGETIKTDYKSLVNKRL